MSISLPLTGILGNGRVGLRGLGTYKYQGAPTAAGTPVAATPLSFGACDALAAPRPPVGVARMPQPTPQ